MEKTTNSEMAKIDFELREILHAHISRIDQLYFGMLEDMEKTEIDDFLMRIYKEAHKLYDQIQKSIVTKAYELNLLNEQIQVIMEELNSQKQEVERILGNTLPDDIINELKENGRVKPKKFDHAIILFIDIVNFTKISEGMSPEQLIDKLDVFFGMIDQLAEQSGVERIKIIGDCYMCGTGFTLNQQQCECQEAAKNCINMCLSMLNYMKQLPEISWQVRIGINHGPIVSGLVGTKNYVFDVWGDTVNVAARAQSASEPNRINITQSVYDLVKDSFTFESRGKVTTKNKGEINMYFVAHEK